MQPRVKPPIASQRQCIMETVTKCKCTTPQRQFPTTICNAMTRKNKLRRTLPFPFPDAPCLIRDTSSSMTCSYPALCGLFPHKSLPQRVIPNLRGPKYSSPPTPVNANPTHHSRSGLMRCTISSSCLSELQLRRIGGTSGERPRFAFAAAVAEAVDTGCRVVVGSICGGE
jgi:hypothetical protein